MAPCVFCGWPMTDDWEAFDAETANQLALWHAYLGLWRMEVIATRSVWQLWPNSATRAAYVAALAEREKCAATVAALEGFDRVVAEPLNQSFSGQN